MHQVVSLFMLDYTFLIIVALLGIRLMLVFRDKYFYINRKLDVDLVPLYVKLLALRKKGVTDAYIRSCPRRW